MSKKKPDLPLPPLPDLVKPRHIRIHIKTTCSAFNYLNILEGPIDSVQPGGVVWKDVYIPFANIVAMENWP